MTFPDCPDGYNPWGGLIQATDGNLYGTTGLGVNGSTGSIFNIAPNGVNITMLHGFVGADGSQPEADLLQATDGNFYGVTLAGGRHNYGTVFSLSTGLAPFIRMVAATGRVGQTRGILGQGFTGATNVSFNGIPATFTVRQDTFLVATVPAGATTGYVTVATPTGTLTSNVPFHVLP